MTSVPPPHAAPPEPAAHPSPPDLPELPAGLEPTPRAPGWRWWSAIVGFVAAFAAATVFGAIVFGVSGDFEDPPAAANILATVIQDVCLVVTVVLFAALVERPRPWQFGLRRPRSVKTAVGLTILAYVVFLVFTAVWLTLIGRSDTQDDLPDELGADDSTVALLAVAFLVTVLAPISEEMFFRGFFFPSLRNSWGLWPAAGFTGLVFGAIHGGSSDIAFLLPLAFLGFVLCMLYQRTGSLYPCIALHCVNNSIAFGASQDWTWQVPLLLAVSLVVIAAAAALVQRLARGGGPVPAHP